MSRYDRIDPGTDPEYCNGLHMTRSEKRLTATERLKTLADPKCPDCDGEGIVSYSSRQQADGYVDVACTCTQRTGAEEDGDPEAWAGGFAENH